MFDLNFIRENAKKFDTGLARRGAEAMSAAILKLDAERRDVQTRMQDVQAARNAASKEIGAAKSRGEDAADAIAAVGELKASIQSLEDEDRDLGARLKDMLSRIPNLPMDSVPDGASEDENVELRIEGTPAKFSFTPKEHFDLGEGLGMMDFERAAKMSGARFVMLSGQLARMERALGQFMLDLHTGEHGYEERMTPAMVRDEALFGTGQLPKFGEDLFRTENDYYLIPTAEVTLSNIHAGEIIPASELPKRFTALTQCFRSEAGAAGRDTRGMIRQHQFNKVELVSVVAPEDGESELERMTGAAEQVLKRLGLPYRVVALCTGDIGFGARKTFDLEVWLPGQDRYREISSCSLCGDFQARRMNMRMRPEGEKKTTYPSTLNGSGVAVGRALVAVMENYQNEDGSIRVPDALKPYMGGIDVIAAS